MKGTEVNSSAADIGTSRAYLQDQSKRNRYRYLFPFKLLLIFALGCGLAFGGWTESIQAFNYDNTGGGGKPIHFAGYKYLNDHQLQIWFDKGASSSTTAEHFRIYEGLGTAGRLLSVRSLAAGSGTNYSVTGLSTGSSFILNMYTDSSHPEPENTFQAGQTYTVIISTTLRANNNITLGAFNGNKNVMFSFTVPTAQMTYDTSVNPEVHYWVDNGATGVPVEGNMWFAVNVPVANAEQVKSGMILKENGLTIPFDTTIDANPVAGAKSFSPQVNNDATYFFIPLTGGGGSGSYDLSLAATYSLEIPAMTTVNGYTIPATSISFTTVGADVPGTMISSDSSSPVAVQSNGKLQIGWNILANAAGYNIYYSNNRYWDFHKLNAAAVRGTNYDISGLSQGSYYFRVAGVNSGGEGGLSPDVQGMVPEPAVTAAPHWVNGTLTHSGLTASALTLQWSGAVDDDAVTEFKLYQNGSSLTAGTVTGSTYAVSGLTSGTPYTFKVEAVNGSGQVSLDGPQLSVTTLAAEGVPGNTEGSPSGGGDSGTDIAPPTFPSGSTLSCEKVGQLEAEISWTAASDNVGVVGYRLYLDSSSVPAYTLSNVTTVHATGLPTGAHTVKVVAFDAAGNNSTNGPSGPLGGDSTATFSVSMTLVAKEPSHTVLQFDFTNGIDLTLDSVLQKIGLYEQNSSVKIAFSTQNYLKQGTDWDTSIAKLRRLTLTYNNLKDNTSYVVKLPSDLAANNGNTLGHDYSWNFAIGIPATEGGGGGMLSEAEDMAASTRTPDEAGIILEEGGRRILQLTEEKLKEWLTDSTRSSLVLNVDSRTGSEGNVKSIEVVRLTDEIMQLFRNNGKKLFLSEVEGAVWQIPAAALEGSAPLELAWAHPTLSGLPKLPEQTVSQAVYAYSLTADAAGSSVHSAEDLLTLTLPVPAGSADADLLKVYRLNESGDAWEYAGGRISNDRLVVKKASFGTYIVVKSTRSFDDITEHWAKHTIEVMAARQIVNGVDNTHFAPGNSVTRAEFAVLLSRILKLQITDADSGFTDVKQGVWYEASVKEAAAAGIIKGEGKDFRPLDTITRQEMAVMIDRAYLQAAGGVPENENGYSQAMTFNDEASFGQWAVTAITHVYQLEIVEGQSNGSFSPLAQATRAEGATMLFRLMNKLGL